MLVFLQCNIGVTFPIIFVYQLNYSMTESYHDVFATTYQLKHIVLTVYEMYSFTRDRNVQKILMNHLSLDQHLLEIMTYILFRNRPSNFLSEGWPLYTSMATWLDLMMLFLWRWFTAIYYSMCTRTNRAPGGPTKETTPLVDYISTKSLQSVPTSWFRGALLLTWFNFNPNMNK